MAHDPHDDADEGAAPATAAIAFVRSTWARRIGLGLGAMLLLAALVMVWRQQDAISGAWSSIKNQSAWRIAWLLAIVALSILANIALTAAMFNILISRYGKVGIIEMQAVIAAATLMNFLPLRPGLFGRVAYHKAFNNIPVAHSTAVVIQGIGISVGVSAYLAFAVLLQRASGIHAGIAALALMGSLVFLGVIWRSSATMCWAGAIRLTELFVIAARYVAVFELTGSPISHSAGIGFACISVTASMVPFLSNGLGLREWAVGITAPLLSGVQVELGITADLLIRAAEFVVIASVGCVAFSWLAAHQLGRKSNT